MQGFFRGKTENNGGLTPAQDSNAATVKKTAKISMFLFEIGIKECFIMIKEPLSAEQLHGLGALALASVGDSVYDLLVRTELCANGVSTAGQLHKKRVERVNACAQAAAAHRLEPYLNEDETAVFRRGRNAQPGTVPSSASRGDYQYATAFETLLGWLYLSGQTERLRECYELSKAEAKAQ